MASEKRVPPRPGIVDLLRGRNQIEFMYARSRSSAYFAVGLTFLVGIVFILGSVSPISRTVAFALSSERGEAVVEQVHSDYYVVRLSDGRRGRVESYSGKPPSTGQALATYWNHSTIPTVSDSRWLHPLNFLLVLPGIGVLLFGLKDLRRLRKEVKSYEGT